MQRPALAVAIRGEIRIFGKGLHQRLLGRRHLVIPERNSVEEADDAPRHRAQVMQRIRLERDDPERCAARVVRTVKIAFQHQPPAADDDDGVHVPDALVGNGLAEPRLEIGGKSGFGRLRHVPIERCCRRTFSDRSDHENSSCGCQHPPAVEHCCGPIVTFRPATTMTARIGSNMSSEASLYSDYSCGAVPNCASSEPLRKISDGSTLWPNRNGASRPPSSLPRR